MVTLANAFAERGFTVDLVLASATGPYLSEVSSAVNVVDLKRSRVITSLPGLVEYLRRKKPTALLSAMGHANVIALLARDLARVATRVVVSERANLSVYSTRANGFRKRLMTWFMGRAYRRANASIAVSAGVADDLVARTGLQRETIDVVFNPVVGEYLQEMAEIPAEYPWLPPDTRPLILALGRLVEQKGFSTLIRAFARLRAERSVRLVILGEGELRQELESETERLGVSSDVVLPGFVNNPFPVLRQANLFVLSSGWEGLPNGLIQAMACGTPVVSTDCPSGPAEILENGRWGRLVPVGDEVALAEAMAETLDEAEHPDVSARAAYFSLDRAVEGYLDLMLPEETKERSYT